jgi:hypothetical protein
VLGDADAVVGGGPVVVTTGMVGIVVELETGVVAVMPEGLWPRAAVLVGAGVVVGAAVVVGATVVVGAAVVGGPAVVAGVAVVVVTFLA